jgi:hypothetical protein
MHHQATVIQLRHMPGKLRIELNRQQAGRGRQGLQQRPGGATRSGSKLNHRLGILQLSNADKASLKVAGAGHHRADIGRPSEETFKKSQPVIGLGSERLFSSDH